MAKDGVTESSGEGGILDTTKTLRRHLMFIRGNVDVLAPRLTNEDDRLLLYNINKSVDSALEHCFPTPEQQWAERIERHLSAPTRYSSEFGREELAQTARILRDAGIYRLEHP